MNYDTINNFQINNENYLFYDIFIRNNELILLCPFYINDINNIDIYINESKLNNMKIIEDTQSLFKVLIYSINNTDSIISVIVIYNLVHNTYLLNNVTLNNKYKLTASTLFKNDYFLFNIYTNYYKKQGVEFFYLYYNGRIDDLPNRSDFAQNNIKLIEWNYNYFNYSVPLNYPLTFPIFAQAGQLTHALYKYGKLETTFMLFNDFDEYTYNPKYLLKELITKFSSYDTIYFRGNICDMLDDDLANHSLNTYLENLKNYKNIPDTFWKSSTIYPITIGSKCIHNVNSIYLLYSPHGTIFYYNSYENPAHNPLHIYTDEDTVLLHFIRWSGRSNRTKNNYNENFYIFNYKICKN